MVIFSPANDAVLREIPPPPFRKFGAGCREGGQAINPRIIRCDGSPVWELNHQPMCRDFGTTYKVQVEMRMIPTLCRDDFVDTDNPGCQ